MRDFAHLQLPDAPGFQRHLNIMQVLAEMALGDAGDVVNLLDIPQEDTSLNTMPPLAQ